MGTDMRISHFLLIALFLQTGNGDETRLLEQAKILENYETAALDTIIEVVENDLLSDNCLLQDAGCIILLKTLERRRKGDNKADSVVAGLSCRKKAVNAAADIIDSRLLGWYGREKSEENDNDIKIYTPLLHILGKSDDKNAKGTLARSFLYLFNRKEILKGIPLSEEMVALSLKKLKTIKEKLCCLYPGREYVVEMLEKDSRSGMLDMFENLLMTNKSISGKAKNEIKEFIVDCMEYGDAKNGHLIRIKAMKIAGILVKGGEKDLAKKIEEKSKSDPYYEHVYSEHSGYSLTELKYPVREIGAKILLR
jgi:hypothetical protein